MYGGPPKIKAYKKTMGIVLLCSMCDSDFISHLMESKPGLKNSLLTMFKVLSSIGANELDV